MVPAIVDSLLQRSLEDLIKGLRIQMIGETQYLNKAMEDIRKEIKSTDHQMKAIALQKLTYLNMLHGFDMNWASFHVVEVMSMPRFFHKKIGYLAACQSFSEQTEVLLLITNQLKKDLGGTNEYEVGLALNCLSVIATCDLARDLTPDIFTLLGSSKIYVKKKAISVVLRIFKKYPDAVRVAFKRLVENLERSDVQTSSAVIGVFCELTMDDPVSYLPLAPEFYRLLVDSKNNWVLIKVLKIFAVLAPLEPRLAKRIVEQVSDLMRKTMAKSLLLECIRTVVSGLSDYKSAVQLSAEKIRDFLVEDDPNLKYLGLQVLSTLMPNHLWAVLENKELIVKSLDDEDPSIRLVALNLVMGMVSEENLVEFSQVLVHYALKSEPEFSNKILGSVLSTCSRNLYQLVSDFDWYVALLGDISRNPHCRHGQEIERQLIDIALRVEDARAELVRVSRDLLIDPALLGNQFLHRVLSAAAWICGEFSEFLKDPFEIMEALIQPRTVLLPPLSRAVYIQSALKVLVFCFHGYMNKKENMLCDLHSGSRGSQRIVGEDLSLQVGNGGLEVSETDGKSCSAAEGSESVGGEILADFDEIEALRDDGLIFKKESLLHLVNLIKMAIGPLLESDDVELLERARNLLGLVDLLEDSPGFLAVNEGEENANSVPESSEIIELMHGVFLEELTPVSVHAQERVQAPDGLTLPQNLSELAAIIGEDPLSPSGVSIGPPQSGEWDNISFLNKQKQEPEPSGEGKSLLEEHRKRHGLFYLSPSKGETESNLDYPSANVVEAPNDTPNAPSDLVRLTEKTFVSKKPTRAKPRPVVVKIDDGDEVVTQTEKQMKGSKEDLLAGVIRDVLLSGKGDPSSSSSHRKEKNIMDMHTPEENSEAIEKNRHGSPSSKRTKHKSHGKGRHKSSGKNEGNEKHKNGHHQNTKHRSWRRAESPRKVDPQAQVIPDFLL
ncbi:hypothetical protein AMTRI_Chr13g85340 [Amborella trichopoda]